MHWGLFGESTRTNQLRCMVNNVISYELIIEQGGELPDTAPHFIDDIWGKVDAAYLLMLLTPRQREVTLLKMTGFQTSREIAQIMGCSVSTVDQELRRIRDRLNGAQ